jgi:hypothetical protein
MAAELSQLRLEALRLAVNACGFGPSTSQTAAQIASDAAIYLNFLLNGAECAEPVTTPMNAAAPATATDAPSTAPVVTAEAPAKRRGRPAKAAPAPEPQAPASAVVETPSASLSSSADEKVYTDSDLRTALTQASTRLGSKEKPVAILQKYAGADKPPIVASIAVADYGKVIAECAALA